jgi:hypothetical protein
MPGCEHPQIMQTSTLSLGFMTTSMGLRATSQGVGSKRLLAHVPLGTSMQHGTVAVSRPPSGGNHKAAIDFLEEAGLRHPHHQAALGLADPAATCDAARARATKGHLLM